MTSWIQINPHPPQGRLTQSGLLLISTKTEIVRGTVVAVPEGEPELAEGDEIFFAKDMLESTEIDGTTVFFLKKASVFCKIVDEQLVPINNMFLLSIVVDKVVPDSRQYNWLLNSDGTRVKIDYAAEAFDAAPKRSMVKAVPKVLTGMAGEFPVIGDVSIRAGDYVFHHHLASNERFKIEFNGETIYWQNYHEIYAVDWDGITIPTERYVFIKPLEESEESVVSKSGIYLKPKKGLVHATGHIKYASPYSISQGFSVGALVKFHDHAKYEIIINGQLLYKTRIKNIYACSNTATETITI